MKCPFCGAEMEHGVMSGDARSPLVWENEKQHLDFLDKMIGRGNISAKRSWSTFKLEGDYCPKCRKMILDADVEMR